MTLLHPAKSSLARRLTAAGALAVLACLAAGSAGASVINLGYLSYDVTSPGASAEFDISNITGLNATALADYADFPVVSDVNLSSLSLTVDFSDGSTQSFGSSYFSLAGDGLSFNGSTIGIGGLNPQPTAATLTGDFSGTDLTLYDGSTVSIDPSFSVTVLPSTGTMLNDGDYGLIQGTVAASTGSVPEPDSLGLALAGIALLGLAYLTRRRSRALLAPMGVGVALTLGFAATPASAVNLSTAAVPSSGVAGVTYVNLTASGMPAGLSPSQVTITLAPTCAAGATGPVSGAITTSASSLRSILSLSRIGFQIPAAAAQETYFASVSGKTTGGTAFASGDCAIIAVSHSSATLNACVPTSSMAVATGTNVVAYVPNGAWDYGTTGIEAVTLEGTGSPVTIPTTVKVNSCAANPATGEAVCTGNDTSVFVVNGSTESIVATLTSGATSTADFSGGFCQNCGVAINALSNKAYIAIGYSGAPSNDAIQSLDLSTNTFSAPFPLTHPVSEDISVDPTRSLILSPGESNNYDVIQLSSTGAPTQEFGNQQSVYGDFDSAAEDCSTGIALASQEFTENVFLADLTQASFTPGTPGTWTAASQSETLAGIFSAGTSGISVASGSSHLGVVTGEFGGSNLAVLQLPSTSGTGTPALVDYAIANLPNTPDGNYFSMGYDPHTITAYTSPNDGRAYAVVADWVSGYPTYLAVIDLQKLLAAPRSDAHDVSSTYDLIANGVVRYVPTH
jgi:hypothetical protein